MILPLPHRACSTRPGRWEMFTGRFTTLSTSEHRTAWSPPIPGSPTTPRTSTSDTSWTTFCSLGLTETKTDLIIDWLTFVMVELMWSEEFFTVLTLCWEEAVDTFIFMIFMCLFVSTWISLDAECCRCWWSLVLSQYKSSSQTRICWCYS